MVNKKTEDKKEKDPFSDSSEMFENIFREATSEIQSETGKVVARPGLKLKGDANAKRETRPKAPIKLELEPKVELDPKPRSLSQPRIPQPALFKSTQETILKPITGTQAHDELERKTGVVPVGPLVRSPVRGQRPKEEPGPTAGRAKASKKKDKGSPIPKVIVFLVLLAAAAGGASIYFGVIDVSDYIGWPEPVKKEAPKVAVTKPSSAQPAARPTQPAEHRAAQPSEPQAKPALPEPPEVAKAETPPPPPAAQAPVKIEPPPAEEQPPAKSQASATGSPGPKSGPKALPPSVQAPTVSKKAEISQTGSQPKEGEFTKTLPPVSGSGIAYPYSVYLGSIQGMDLVKKAMSSYESQGLSPYWSKVDLGAKGTWYRVYAGHFASAQEAEAFIQQKRIKDGEVKETRYSNLIGTFGTKQGGEEKALALAGMGVSAYSIPAADGQVRLYSGAFITKEGAEKNQAELNSRGIKSEIVER